MAHLLAVETTDERDEVTVHADVDGLKALVKVFQALLDHAERGEPAHDHLMTADWGGRELSSEAQATDRTTRVVHHVILYGWPTSAGKRACTPGPKSSG